MNMPPIMSTHVKVMRSHDYCHFEISLGCEGPLTSVEVDNLRKEAARLADKAVEQYKAAKVNAELAIEDKAILWQLADKERRLLAKPETERTPKDQAFLKVMQDKRHRARPHYNYNDDWNEPNYEEPEYNDNEDAVF